MHLHTEPHVADHSCGLVFDSAMLDELAAGDSRIFTSARIHSDTPVRPSDGIKRVVRAFADVDPRHPQFEDRSGVLPETFLQEQLLQVMSLYARVACRPRHCQTDVRNSGHGSFGGYVTSEVKRLEFVVYVTAFEKTLHEVTVKANGKVFANNNPVGEVTEMEVVATYPALA